MNTTNPAPQKRHPALIPLSHDHHQGLLLIWKIRQGITYGISNSRIGKYIQYFSEHDLLAHFLIEETQLIKVLPSADQLANQMLSEHKKLRAILLDIQQDENEISHIQKFAKLLEEHIRFEERILFPYIQETIALDSLSFQGKEKTDAPSDIDLNWEDQFWLKK